MTQNLTFAADVDAWVKATEQRLEAVFKEATQRVVEEVRTPDDKGGHLPVKTGFMRNSIVASTDGPTPISPNAKPEKGAEYDKESKQLPGPVSLVIAGATLGQTIWVCFTAAYAGYMEYGTATQPGFGFVRLAAQRWPRIVDEVVRELKERAR